MFLPYLALFGKLFHLTYHVSRWLEYGFMTLVMTMVSYPTSTDYDITMVLLIIYKISIMVSFLINHGGYMDTLRTYMIISLSNMVNRVYIYIYNIYAMGARLTMFIHVKMVSCWTMVSCYNMIP